MPHVPIRTCVGCRRRQRRDALLRVARSGATVAVDPRRRAAGRGAHLCPRAECLELARRNRGLERALRGPVPASIYTELAALIDAENPAVVEGGP